MPFTPKIEPVCEGRAYVREIMGRQRIALDKLDATAEWEKFATLLLLYTLCDADGTRLYGDEAAGQVLDEVPDPICQEAIKAALRLNGMVKPEGAADPNAPAPSAAS
jgi:hypothetical protein